MNAGSTTTALLARAGEAARPGRADRRPSSCHCELEAGEREGAVGELPHRVQLPGAEDVVAVERRLVGAPPRLGLAEDRDHPLDVVGREAPVALRLQVPERERAVRRARRGAPARGRPPCARGTAARAGATRG